MAATLFATMRDEAPFILEWVAYHLAIGFENIIVFSNDCVDGSDQILAALSSEGVITHIPHEPDPDQKIAEQVSHRILAEKMIADGEWAIWLDADEFLNIHAGRGTVAELTDYIGDARGMCISWRTFGDAGQDIFYGAFLDEKFVRCASPGEAWQNVKTLFRHGPDVAELFQHKPIMAPVFWEKEDYFLSSIGRKLHRDNQDAYMSAWTKGKKRGKIAETAAGWDIAQINHYAVRTKSLFERKQRRGRIGKANSENTQRYTKRYFRGMNLNHAYDRSILRWSDRVCDRKNDLEALLRKKLDVDALIAEHYPSEIVAISSMAAADRPSQGESTISPSENDRHPERNKPHYDEVIKSNGVLVPYVKEVISPGLKRQLRRNRYEGGELIALREELKPGDRVLELGAGVGLISTVAANTEGVEWVCAVEANPHLIPIIAETHRLNGAQKVTLLNGVVTPHAGDSVDFYLRADFWSSSMDGEARPYLQKIKVQTYGIGGLIKKSDPTVIICDIEGGELGLFDDIDFSGVRSVLIEFHPKVYGRRAARSLYNLFERNGLQAIPEERRTNVRRFQRR